MSFSFEVVKKDSGARLGVIKTPHGDIQTPAYTPVATSATVKALDTEDIVRCGSQVVLANTYHLLLRPGLEVIESFGGFAPFMKWEGPTITDSGGYQVSFLRTSQGEVNRADGEQEIVKITDEGATFKSYVDGSKQLITPERSMEIQAVLGADIIMAFDQPLGKDYSDKKISEAFKRTLHWEERSFIHWEKIQRTRKIRQLADQALYGIVQGGTNVELRRESLKFILDTGFP